MLPTLFERYLQIFPISILQLSGVRILSTKKNFSSFLDVLMEKTERLSNAVMLLQNGIIQCFGTVIPGQSSKGKKSPDLIKSDKIFISDQDTTGIK